MASLLFNAVSSVTSKRMVQQPGVASSPGRAFLNRPLNNATGNVTDCVFRKTAPSSEGGVPTDHHDDLTVDERTHGTPHSITLKHTRCSGHRPQSSEKVVAAPRPAVGAVRLQSCFGYVGLRLLGALRNHGCATDILHIQRIVNLPRSTSCLKYSSWVVWYRSAIC